MHIALDRLRVDCNIWRLSIQDLKMFSQVNKHTTIEINAIPETEDTGLMSSDLSGQPISVRVRDSDDVLFYGIVFEATEYWGAGYRSLRITARSLSWLLDLEKKSRSFQKTKSQHTEIINTLLEEYGASAIFNFEDKPINKPYIQYDETDWAFIRRICSRLGAHVFPSARTEYPGLYIGFPAKGKAEPVDSVSYRLGIDDEFLRIRVGEKSKYVYYEVEDYTPRQMGDKVLFQGSVWHVSAIRAQLKKGVLSFIFRLTGSAYNSALPEYNLSFCGLSLTGKVLERQAEKLRLHLEIDEEQNVEDAYDYTWLPETGNIMYNMPPVGTRVSLYMQNTDEQSAICIRNTRDNGTACALTQKPDERYLTTEPQKSLSVKPETIDLTAMESADSVLIDDNFGCRITCAKEVLIQASGNVSITGANVEMKAPQEMTSVRRNLGEPTVVNLCHNVDSFGGKGKFQATGKYLKPRKAGKGQLTSSEFGRGEDQKMTEREKRNKLKFELAELMRQSDIEPRYDITDVFRIVAAAVPQQTVTDELARFSGGSRVLFGNKEDYMNVTIGKEWRNWEESSYQSAQSLFAEERIKDNIREYAAIHPTKGNSRFIPGQ